MVMIYFVGLSHVLEVLTSLMVILYFQDEMHCFKGLTSCICTANNSSVWKYNYSNIIFLNAAMTTI